LRRKILWRTYIIAAVFAQILALGYGNIETTNCLGKPTLLGHCDFAALHFMWNTVVKNLGVVRTTNYMNDMFSYKKNNVPKNITYF